MSSFGGSQAPAPACGPQDLLGVACSAGRLDPMGGWPRGFKNRAAQAPCGLLARSACQSSLDPNAGLPIFVIFVASVLVLVLVLVPTPVMALGLRGGVLRPERGCGAIHRGGAVMFALESLGLRRRLVVMSLGWAHVVEALIRVIVPPRLDRTVLVRVGTRVVEIPVEDAVLVDPNVVEVNVAVYSLITVQPGVL